MGSDGDDDSQSARQRVTTLTDVDAGDRCRHQVIDGNDG